MSIMKQKIFLIIINIVLLVAGIEIFGSFMSTHPYYGSILQSGNNWLVLLGAIAGWLIPLGYLRFSKTPKLKQTYLALYVWLILFSIIQTGVKGWLIDVSSIILLVINITFLFVLATCFILGVTSIGNIIMNKLKIVEKQTRTNIILGFSLGLGALLVLIHFLIIAKLLYPLITRVIFIGLVYVIYIQRKKLKEHSDILEKSLLSFKDSIHTTHIRKFIPIILFVASCMYFFYGLNNSFIAYPTAWDANHAYMYIPKVRAENHGALGVNHPGGAGGFIWFSYITLWFSLMQPLKSWFRLSPDSIATSMNFLSGIFVLIGGLSLIQQVTGYILDYTKTIKSKITNISNISLYTGWFGLLAWMTSGMGAFLLFVDNKTDMGVFALTIIAMLSGFIALRYIHTHKDSKSQKTNNKYMIISGLLFGLAVLAKPTAFIDIALFAILLLWLRCNIGIAIGVGFLTVGILAKLQVLFSYVYLNPEAGWPLIIIGILILIISAFYQIYYKNWLQARIKPLRSIWLWAVSLVVIVVVTKTPYLLPTQLQNNTFSPSNFIQWLIMSHSASLVESKSQTKSIKTTILASTNNPILLAQQEQIDQNIQTPNAVCSIESLGLQNTQALYANTRKLPENEGLNEDVGRYVGFGRKEFTAPRTRSSEQKKSYWPIRLAYPLLRLIFPKDNICYGSNKIAKQLCNNQSAVDNLDRDFINELYNSIDQQDKIYPYLETIVQSPERQNNEDIDVGIFRSEIIQLRQYYQGHSIYTQNNAILIPYRFIVPFNIVFNRSLQNYSSYYTDIGFIRLFFFIFIDIAIIYSLIRRQRKLFVISATAWFWWIIWWFIAGGIVWYGIGLIMRTILNLIAFLINLAIDTKENKTIKRRYSFLILASIWAVIQLILNFMRISSQGGSWPFAQYKASVGTEYIFTDMLQQQTQTKVAYGAEDILKLQFPHYLSFIEHTADKPAEHGISIAWTYLQYFLKSQENVGTAPIQELTSDGNTCKSYLRFKDKGRKYIVTDPNILSIVMGEGNESLMTRYFARVNPSNGQIIEDGEMTMLVKMRYDNYIKLFNSNNLGAKYAFSVTDEEIEEFFGPQTYDKLVYLRAKISVARFFPNEPQLINFVGNVFTQRLMTEQGLEDIADILGRKIDTNKTLNVAIQVVNNQSMNQNLQDNIAILSQDERMVLAQFLTMYNTLRVDPNQYQQMINSLLQQSLASSSQIIILEIVD
jgi:hypothetical protein